MSVQLSETDYYTSLVGGSVTLGWDVVVSYTAKELNTLLQTQWASSGTSKITVQRPNLRHHYSTTYDLILGAPSLQFNTDHSGSVSLHCTLDGTYRDDDIDDNGNVTKNGTTVSTLKSGTYVLSINVPLQAVNADGNKVAKDPAGVIQFSGDNPTTTYLTFHFKNVEQTMFKVDKLEGSSKLPEDDDIADLGGRNGLISNWFGNKDHVQWINISVAQIANTKPSKADAGVSNLLTPKSFIFATQSNTQGGILMIFMQTEGSGNQPGNPTPSFVAPQKSGTDVAAIPSGYHANIIISNSVFADGFLRKQIAAKLGTSASVIATTEGYRIKCPIKQAKKQFEDFAGNLGPFGFHISGINIDLEKDPMMELTLKKDGTNPLAAKWSLENTGSLAWDVTGVDHTDDGEVYFTIKADQTQNDVFTVTDNKISGKLKLTRAAFSTNWSWKSDGGAWGKKVPDRISEKNFQFDDIEMTFPELNFFATQNVFAPGKQAILTKNYMAPYDFIILGDVVAPGVVPTSKRQLLSILVAPPSFHHLSRREVGGPQGTPDKQRMKAMMDGLVEDNFGLVVDLVKALDASDEEAFKKCFTSRNYDLTNTDPKCLDSLIVPGPDFDLRYCAGIYQLESSSTTVDAGQMIYVDALKRTIWVDGAAVSAQKVDSDGVVTFKTDAGTQYSLKFSGSLTEEGDPVDHMFSGTAWSQSALSATIPIKATRLLRPAPAAHPTISRRRQQIDSTPGLVPWYSDPAYLNYTNIAAVFGTLSFSYSVLKFTWVHGKPHMIDLLRKLNFMKQVTAEELQRKLYSDFKNKTIDLRQTGSNIDRQAKQAAMAQVKLRTETDPQNQDRTQITNNVKENVRNLIMDDLKSHIRSEAISRNAAIIPLNQPVEVWDRALVIALRDKMNATITQSFFNDYVDALVSRGIAEVAAANAEADVASVEKDLAELQRQRATRDSALHKARNERKAFNGTNLTPAEETQKQLLDKDITTQEEANVEADAKKMQLEEEKKAKSRARDERQNKLSEEDSEYERTRGEAFRGEHR